MLRIARVMAMESEKNGGLLMHGALVEKNGLGVILAGPGGVGKTTAARRLPVPWRLLSDDMCLIAKTRDGGYWAHPWPTWSRIRRGDLSGSWDVPEAVPVRLICMLSQQQNNHLAGISYLQSVSELVDVSGQTAVFMTAGMEADWIRGINRLRFHNAVAMAKRLPVFRLNISLKGKFWEEIEAFIETDRK